MADFDGIREAEAGKKKMPLGMTVLFWGLIVFGVSYIYLFTPAFTGWTQMRQYERAQRPPAPAPAGVPAVAATGDEARIAQGREIYAAECAMCHGDRLEGSGAAPGLRGPKFIYGSSIDDHIRIITNGTPNNMPKYAGLLTADQIRSVALYIRSSHSQ